MATSRTGNIPPCRSTCSRCRIATGPTASSSRDCAGRLDHRAQPPTLPELLGAVASPDEPPGALPLRQLPAPLRAGVGLPELRRALDHRPHGALRDDDLQPLRR